MGLFALWNSMIDREKFWTNLMGNAVPESISSILPSAIAEMEVRNFSMSIWLLANMGLIVGAFTKPCFMNLQLPTNLSSVPSPS